MKDVSVINDDGLMPEWIKAKIQAVKVLIEAKDDTSSPADYLVKEIEKESEERKSEKEEMERKRGEAACGDGAEEAKTIVTE
mgnify:CR=1 FL=1